MVEQRRAQRDRVLKVGTIEFGGGAIDCSIRNISKFGAVLEVVSLVGIPENFTLVIPADRVRHQCSLVWRSERRIGLVFELALP